MLVNIINYISNVTRKPKINSLKPIESEIHNASLKSLPAHEEINKIVIKTDPIIHHNMLSQININPVTLTILERD